MKTVLLLFSAFFFSLQNADAASAKPVLKAHRSALELVKKLKIAPPKVAQLFAIANEIGATVSEERGNPKEFVAGFVETFSLAYPEERYGLQSENQVDPSNPKIKTALIRARRLWDNYAADLESAEMRADPPWPNEGFGRGHWKPTEPKYAQPLYPYWGRLPLWAELDVEDLVGSISPFQFGDENYLKEMEDVRRIGGRESSDRAEHQTLIAGFWAAGGGTVTPPGMWIEITLNLLEDRRRDFNFSVKALRAMTGALADAGIVAWNAKFKYDTCRPLTAIEDLLQDKEWRPLLDTPPFPSYISGHSTFSAAAATVIDLVVRRSDEKIVVTSSTNPGVRREFLTAWDAALEAGLSRIYGGIHFQSDNAHGLKLGREIGEAHSRISF